MIHLLLPVIYLAFINLGLPDSLLGAAWPSISVDLGAPVSYAGIISMIIAAGTIVSSLQSDRLTRALGPGLVTALSAVMTAAALIGFSMSRSFPMLCLWAIPYGLSAGSVDAALNNYVALHYASRHMSWLHCMWGVGASLGPYLMGFALTGGGSWNAGYRYASWLQISLAVILLLSLPLWKMKKEHVTVTIARIDSGKETSGGQAPASSGQAPVSGGHPEHSAPLSLAQVLAIPGARSIMAAFFCYCSLEQTAMLWFSSFFALSRGIPADTAASWASLFFLGITAGRGVSGFLTAAFDDHTMIRLGQAVILVGLVLLLLPLSPAFGLAGLLLVGLGCAPIYPCIIHSTPSTFGPERSQALIGVQMASAYIGTCLIPPFFGLVANHISIVLLPAFLLAALVLMVLAHENLLRGMRA